MERTTEKDFLKRHPQASISYPARTLGGRAAVGFAAQFKNQAGVAVKQSYVSARRWLKMFTLIETERGTGCETELDRIAKSVRF